MKNDYFGELRATLRAWPAWYYYALQDIKNKYSRSVIGPLWITISVAVTVTAMGPLYKIIFNITDPGYFIHLAAGLVFWFWMSGTLGDACTAFIGNESFIKQSKLPLYVYIARCMLRNLLILMHNIIIVVFMYLYTGQFSLNVLLVIPGLLLVSTVLFFSSYIIAFVCARYRDVVPLIANILQLFMFLTPIFWMANEATEKSKYVVYNPFNYLINLLRQPFKGEAVDFSFYYIGLLFVVFIFIVSYFFHTKYSKQVVFWI
jgi:lipopolysaccharide transport system permease protein